MNKRTTSQTKAFSIVEILVAIGVFMLIISSVGVVVLDSLRGFRNDEYRTEAYLQLDSMVNLILQRKSDFWTDMILYTDAGAKNITTSGSTIVIGDGSIVQNEITSWFEVNRVYRDVNGDLVLPGSGTEDPYSRSVTFNLTWTDPLGNNKSVTDTVYLNDWNTARWTVTTTAEFDLGAYNSTVQAPVGNGAVGLETLLYPDWCEPDLTLSYHDIPGNGDARTVTGLPGNAYMGTGGNASGVAFTHVSITGVVTPVINVEGTYDSSKVNDIFVDPTGNWAYLTSDDNAQEVKVIDLTVLPYVVIGWFNSNGPSNGDAVAYADGIGFLSRGKDLFSFDLSSRVGNRPELDKLAVSIGGSGQISDIKVVGDYAFLSLQNTTSQMAIIDISNPAALVEVATGSVSSYEANKLDVSPDGNRVYIGTEDNTGSEFFIVDTSVKAGPWPTIGHYSTTGMSVTGVTIVQDGLIALLVGSGGEEYQVIDITDETTPTRCGGLDLPYAAYDITSVKDVDGNVFSYAVTADTAKEFIVIRGGGGGGWGSGYGYSRDGEYTTEVFDSGTVNTVYYFLNWFQTQPAPTDIQVQVRSSNLADLSDATWMGPDGTSGTFFTLENGEFVPAALNFKRYIQMKAFLTGDTIDSPILEEISLSYQN